MFLLLRKKPKKKKNQQLLNLKDHHFQRNSVELIEIFILYQFHFILKVNLIMILNHNFLSLLVMNSWKIHSISTSPSQPHLSLACHPLRAGQVHHVYARPLLLHPGSYPL